MAAVNGGSTKFYDDPADDELIADITEEDLKAFADEIDPENDLLPASDRQAPQTTKTPTGEYDRSRLLEHMKSEAIESKVGSDYMPFENKKRGKAFTPKPKKAEEKAMLPDDLSDVLDEATEEELMELAAVLGIHGLLNQRQSEQAESDKVWQSLKGSGLRKYKPGVVGSKKYKQYTDPNAINELNLEDAITQLKNGDDTLKELNLNNHKDMTEETLLFLGDNLRHNNHLTVLYLANCKVTDSILKQLCDALKVNKVLETLNLESNLITSDGMECVLDMLMTNKTLKELKLANQPTSFGYGVENKIASALAKNTTLLRFGFTFTARGPRHTANKHIMRNNDLERLARIESRKLSESSSSEER